VPRTVTDYSEATDYEDALPPESVREGLPEELQDARIKGGGTYPADASIRLNGPPGVGKTTQVCLRVAVLIEEHGIDPADITIVTYRRSLAGEIGDRLKSWGIIDDDADLSMWTTAHAAANRVTGLLSGTYEENTGKGLGPAVTRYEKGYFCRNELDIQYSSAPWDTSRGELLFKVFEYARDNLLDPTQKSDLHQVPAYSDLKEEWPGVDVTGLYERWEAFKQDAALVEFGELLEAAVDGPLPPTEVVVVDEYHDVTPLMAKLCERWIEAASTSLIAGDPLQVVNEYTGADPRFFTERLDHISEVLLTRTWRVPRSHWQAATRMLQEEFDAPPVKRNSRGDINEYKSPRFEKGDGDGWRVPGASQPGSPGALVYEYIDGHDDRSMMILARTRTQVSGISAALEKAGMIHSTHDSDLGGWTQRRVRLLNALLKLNDVPAGYATSGSQSGLHAYNSDAVQLRLTAAEAATLLEHTNGRVLELTNDDREEFVAALRGDDNQVVTADDLDEVVKPSFWERYTSGMASVSELTKAGELNDEELTALQTALSDRDEPVASDAPKHVRVLTIHASKGSEATDVVVYDGITNTVASEVERSRRKSENEARTWYVALSRSSERLHIMRDGFRWMNPHLPGDIRQTAGAAAERVAAASDSEATGSQDVSVVETPDNGSVGPIISTDSDPSPDRVSLSDQEKVDRIILLYAGGDRPENPTALTGEVAQKTNADAGLVRERIDAYCERIGLLREVYRTAIGNEVMPVEEIVKACDHPAAVVEQALEVFDDVGAFEGRNRSRFDTVRDRGETNA